MGAFIAYLLAITGWIIHWFFKSSRINNNVLILVFVLVCPLVGTAICTYNNTIYRRQVIPSYSNRIVHEKIKANRILLFIGVVLSIAGLIFVIIKP